MSERLDLNFNHLKYFQIIAREGSIVKASKVLHLTQSTLSDQLRQLEEHLGKKLFDRAPRRLILNEQGRMVLDYVNRIFSMSEEMEESLHQKTRRRIIYVRVGISPSLPKTHVQDFILPFWRKSGTGVTVTEGSLDFLIREIEQARLDIILTDVSVRTKNTKLNNFKLLSRPIVAVANPRLAKLKRNYPQSLDGQPLVTFTEHSQLRSQVDLYFKQLKVRPDLLGEVDDVNLARIIIEKNPAFGILPKKAVSDSLAMGKLVLLKSVDIPSEMWAIATNAIQHNPLVQTAIRTFGSNRSKP